MAWITIQTVKDSFIDGVGAPDTNYGSEGELNQGAVFIGEEKAGLYRSILDFDVSPASGLTIVSAKLRRRITFTSGEGDAAEYARIDVGHWDLWTEAGVTWNKYDGTNAWDSAGGDFDDPPAITYTEATSQGWHEITGFEDLVTDAIANRGNIVAIIGSSSDEAINGWVKFSSHDYLSGKYTPELVIEYTAPAAGVLRSGVALGSANPGIY